MEIVVSGLNTKLVMVVVADPWVRVRSASKARGTATINVAAATHKDAHARSDARDRNQDRIFIMGRSFWDEYTETPCKSSRWVIREAVRFRQKKCPVERR